MILAIGAAGIGVSALYLLFWPLPIEPLAYLPPPGIPLKGALTPNQELRKTEIVAKGLDGPEDTELDAAGRLYTGSSKGEIVRLDEQGNREIFAQTGGRPLGMQFDRQGNLIVCALSKGLLSLDQAGQVEILLSEVEGSALYFANDLDISSNGIIYFSLSTKYRDGRYDFLEGRPHGKLLSYNRKTKGVEVLLDGLYFPNGVALSQKEDFILINETFQYRIRRYWLKGKKAGQSDIFIDRLPGFPDNISRRPNGNFWLALYALRDEEIDKLHKRPFLKKIAARLPNFLWPDPDPYGLIVELSREGKILRSLHDPDGQHIAQLSSAKERGNWLYLGTAGGREIARYRLK